MTCRLRPAHARQSNSRGEASCLTAQAQGCTCAQKPGAGGGRDCAPSWKNAGAIRAAPYRFRAASSTNLCAQVKN